MLGNLKFYKMKLRCLEKKYLAILLQVNGLNKRISLLTNNPRNHL